MNKPDRCEMHTYAGTAGVCEERHASGKFARREKCISGMDVCAEKRSGRAAFRESRLRCCGRLTRLLAVVLLLPALLLGACTMDKADNGKVRDLEFTVIGEGDAPQELKDLIAQKKTQPFKLTYSDDQNLYIVIGYGPQSTGGYSITVEELYLTENSIFFNTELKGPAKGEPAAPETSYPLVIVKTEYLEDPVVFD